MTKAWHCTRIDKSLGYNDGRTVVAGETLIHEGELVLCKRGLHASTRLLDALLYAPGAYVWRVELSGTIVHGSDKLVASKRKPIWGFDATTVLLDFTRRCALDVMHLWNPPDVMARFLRTGDPSLATRAYAAAHAAEATAATRVAYAAYVAAAYAAAAYANPVFGTTKRTVAARAAYAAHAAADSIGAVTYAGGGDAAISAAAGYDAAKATRTRQNRRLTSMVTTEAKLSGVYR